VDVMLGHLHLQRRAAANLYVRAAAALPQDFAGSVFVYNAPYSGRVIRQRCPNANVVLYLGNQIWRSYSVNEARRALRWVDHVVCISQFLADDFRTTLPGVQSVLHVIHSGAELDLFSPRQEHPANDEPLILFVGRTLQVKGPDLLIEAAARLAATGKRFKLRIVGSENFNSSAPLTPYERSLRRAALPLSDRVEFQPFVDRRQLPAIFESADIFCVPSRWQEPLGLVVLEGLAAGLPMVVARRGGIPEVAGDAVLYFDPKDVSGLVHQLGRLLDDAPLRAQLRTRARAQAERWSWANQYRRLRAALDPQFKGAGSSVTA
jgi:glycosyltransferase involved in cell wall biosynthesis